MCIFVAVNCAHMRSEFVWPGESRRSSTLDISNYKALVRLFRRMLSYNIPLKLLYLTKSPGIAIADIVVY